MDIRFKIRLRLTLIHFHIRDSLPLVHGHKPARLAVRLLPATAEVDDQLALFPSQGSQDGAQPGLAKMCLREEEGCYDDLLSFVLIISPVSICLPRRPS